MVELIVYYFGIGYIVNNIVALIQLYSMEYEEEADVAMGNFIITIPVWPHTLYVLIASFFQKDE